MFCLSRPYHFNFFRSILEYIDPNIPLQIRQKFHISNAETYLEFEFVIRIRILLNI